MIPPGPSLNGAKDRRGRRGGEKWGGYVIVVGGWTPLSPSPFKFGGSATESWQKVAQEEPKMYSRHLHDSVFRGTNILLEWNLLEPLQCLQTLTQ